MSLTIRPLLADAAKTLKAAGIDNPRFEARLLLAFVLNQKAQDLMFAVDHTLYPGDTLRFKELVQRRVKKEPLAYLVKKKSFWKHDWNVGSGVLIPRPETELIIETALQWFQDADAPLSILDLGTGSGCLLLSLLEEFPNALGLGVDLEHKAIEFALNNAQTMKLDKRAFFARMNWCSGLKGVFDLIVCNPPYISASEYQNLEPDVRDFEPVTALVAGKDGLDDYRTLAHMIQDHMHKETLVLFETGSSQRAELELLLTEADLEIVIQQKDLAGHDRMTGCMLLSQNEEYDDG